MLQLVTNHMSLSAMYTYGEHPANSANGFVFFFDAIKSPVSRRDMWPIYPEPSGMLHWGNLVLTICTHIQHTTVNKLQMAWKFSLNNELLTRWLWFICQMDPLEQTWVKFQTKHVSFHPAWICSSELCYSPWWRHQMETFSALLAICAGNSPVPGEFPA